MYGDAAGTRDYLRYAQRLGLKVIVGMGDPTLWNGTSLRSTFRRIGATCGCSNNRGFITYVVHLVKNSPALWGYYVADEIGAEDHDRLKAFSDLVKQLDPDHPRLNIETTEQAGGGVARATSILQTMADTADVLGVDFYPVGSSGAGEYVSQTGSIAAAVQSVADSHGKGSAIALQAMDWSEYPHEEWRCGPAPDSCPWPTLTDMQAMLNLALEASSPRLVLWYSYFDILRSDDPRQHWRDVTIAANSVDSVPRSHPQIGM
jgi:hypothetical protein